MDNPSVYDQKVMTTEDWLSILRLQWQDFKDSINLMKELGFTQNKLASKMVNCKPLGNKVKGSQIAIAADRAKEAQVKVVAAP